jgi:glycosyltransferase involved in cell wall biosynthesis
LGHFDVVTAQDPFWRGLFAWVVARRLHASLNVQVHADLDGQRVVKRMLAKAVLRHAHSVRVVSEKIKLQMKRLGVRAPITVLPVFVDIAQYTSVVRRPHTAKNILWLGRFEEEKNPLAAIEILKEVLQKVPEARLTMLGAGSLGQEVSQSAANLPIQAIEVLRWQPNPAVFLETADVVLCTSLHESWGASIVEALAAGVPVVAPDVGVAKEAGATVVPRTQLAEAVVEVLKEGGVGVLKLSLPNAQLWAQEWKKTLQ